MRLKTKLKVTAVTMVVLPLLMTAIAFVTIGGIMNKGLSRGIVSDNTRYLNIVEKVFSTIKIDLARDPDILENLVYLEGLNKKIKSDGAFIIVRKGSAIVYKGSKEDLTEIENDLPVYDNSTANNSRVNIPHSFLNPNFLQNQF